ncbi:hypothetical protein BDW68DRAFT_196769 [Aspergillus falconensis]
MCKHWQQKNSHLVHIQSCDPKPNEPLTPVLDHQQIAAEIKARAADDEQQVVRQSTESKSLQDANPWLWMTCWAWYLAGVHFQDILDVVATPDPELVDPVSQATQRHHAEPDPIPAITGVHGREEHPGACPAVAADSRQQKTWQRLWRLALQGEPAAEPAAGPPAFCWSPDPMALGDQDPSRIQAFVMTPLETACLEFCIELLNQKTKVQEYESPLVCAMAVLGRGELGWRDLDSYPPIISQVLKVACFIVVQKALWLDPQHQEIIYIPHAAPICRIPRSRRLPFQAGVDWMVQ